MTMERIGTSSEVEALVCVLADLTDNNNNTKTTEHKNEKENRIMIYVLGS